MASEFQPNRKVAARLLKTAQAFSGSQEALARILKVDPTKLTEWTSASSFPPASVFEQALSIVLDAQELSSAKRAAIPASAATRPKVLIANTPKGCEQLADLLPPDVDSVFAYTRTQAVQVLLQQRVALIIAGMHFDDSQLLRFLEHVRADERTMHIPFIGCSAQTTQLGDMSLSAMRSACEALGAMAYIDLQTRHLRLRDEGPGVEFRAVIQVALRLQPPTRPLRVLVADDNADMAHTLGALLAMAGHDVKQANDGAAALERVQDFQPSVAIVDLRMPKLDGFQIARAAREADWGGDATLIAVSGMPSREAHACALRAGFDFFFSKPVHPDRLLEVFPP